MADVLLDFIPPSYLPTYLLGGITSPYAVGPTHRHGNGLRCLTYLGGDESVTEEEKKHVDEA